MVTTTKSVRSKTRLQKSPQLRKSKEVRPVLILDPELMTEYLFDPTDVKPATLEQLILFLQLPRDKLGI